MRILLFSLVLCQTVGTKEKFQEVNLFCNCYLWIVLPPSFPFLTEPVLNSNAAFFQVTTWDWTRAEKSFTVYEIMCKILKVRNPSRFLNVETHGGYIKRVWSGKLTTALKINCIIHRFICMCSISIPQRRSRFRLFCSFSAGSRSLWIWSWEFICKSSSPDSL